MIQKYLIDANVFIQAKSLHYRFEFCEGFWGFLLNAHHAGLIFSTQKVKDELLQGNDEDLVKKWVLKLPSSFFIPDDKDVKVMRQYAQLMNWAMASTHYTDAAKSEFARSKVADAFLIATAMEYKFKIVTHEKSNPNAKARIIIPDAANSVGVSTVLIYDLLSIHAESTFQLKAA